MLSYQTVESHTLELLRGLMSEPIFVSLRLVGGTALALQYGHRISVDLDLFGALDTDSEIVRSILRKYGDLKVIKESQNIKIYQLNGVKVDIVNYMYSWPKMFSSVSWEEIKDVILSQVKQYSQH